VVSVLSQSDYQDRVADPSIVCDLSRRTGGGVKIAWRSPVEPRLHMPKALSAQQTRRQIREEFGRAAVAEFARNSGELP
jgi:hypothetical protein